MKEPWAFAEELWHEHFAPLRDSGYELERTSEENYWQVHEDELRSHFPSEVFIAISKLRTESAVASQKRIAEARGGHILQDMCIVREEGNLVATFSGEQRSTDTYRMWHTNVHPNFRRRGIYRQILASTIAYTAALGFDRITSEHAPGNNPILIAKLGAGFRITSLEIDPAVGTSLVLNYFHNPDQLAAYEFRCGLATINPRILSSGHGAMSQLIAQFQNSEND